MMSQSNLNEANEPGQETYGRYEGESSYARQQEQMALSHFQEGRAEKVYLPARNMTMVYRLLTLLLALIALLIFVYVCLILVGGTAGIIGFCAASFTIMVLASTMVSLKSGSEK